MTGTTRLELRECGTCVGCLIKQSIKERLDEMARREAHEYIEAVGPAPRRGDLEAGARIQRGWSDARMELIRVHRRELAIGCRMLAVVEVDA